MQAATQLIEALTHQLTLETLPDRTQAVRTPSAPRWSQNPIAGSDHDVDEDEAYFLGDEDEDDDDIYDDDDEDDLDDEEEDLDADVDLDEEDF